MSGEIFISYRREESGWVAGRLLDRLQGDFGTEKIFMDIDAKAIPLGANFKQVIERNVAECDVLIAVIGKNWLSTTDDNGGRRLDNPEDFVRLEIGTALRREICVIPVLVDGVRMPRSTDLPGDLRSLVWLHALSITAGSNFDVDCQRLAAAITLVLEKAAAEEKERLAVGQREKERLEAEQREKERLAAEERQKEPLAAEQRKKERLEAEQREKERLEAKQREKERLEAEQRCLEAEQREKERLEAEQRERKRLEAERREKERLVAEQLEQENERLVNERRDKDRLETARLEAERQTRLAALAQVREERACAEREDLEAEQRKKERLAPEQRNPWALLTSLLVVTLQRKPWALIMPLVVFVLILVVGLIRFAGPGGPPDSTPTGTQAAAQASFYKSRGIEYLSNRLYSIAMSDFDEAIRLNPKDGESYYNRGLCHQGLDQDVEAKADFDKAKQLGYRAGSRR
jgi:tetratricopeptide (TPR) repeat protein